VRSTAGSVLPLLFSVYSINQVLILLCHDSPAYLERWSKLSAVNRQFTLEEPDRLDLFEVRKVFCPVGHLMLKELDHFGIPQKLLRLSVLYAVAFREAFEGFQSGGNQCGWKLTLITNDDCLVNIAALQNQRFNRLGSNVLASAGFDQVLLAVGDKQKPVPVDVTNIAGVKPDLAILIDQRIPS
jgi:hypothetical protein